MIETLDALLKNLGIGYHSSIAKAIEITQTQALKHPNIYDNRTEEEELKIKNR